MCFQNNDDLSSHSCRARLGDTYNNLHNVSNMNITYIKYCSSQMVPTSLNLKKDCRGSPPPADSLSLPIPDWPIF